MIDRQSHKTPAGLDSAVADLSLDDPERGEELANIIRRKPALHRWYREVYQHYAGTLARCPQDGLAIELGAGGGFAKDIIPDLITADVLPYRTVDVVFDACKMPFADRSVRFIAMLNVFHHIPDVAAFLSECQRCLVPNGRVLIVDQYPGWISHWVLKYLHHEPYLPDARDWSFPSTGPLSGANGALAWIVFQRDRNRFLHDYPQLTIESLRRHTPLRYWLSGGLKPWSLIPSPLWTTATLVDRLLSTCCPKLSSFMNVELRKVGTEEKLGVVMPVQASRIASSWQWRDVLTNAELHVVHCFDECVQQTLNCAVLGGCPSAERRVYSRPVAPPTEKRDEQVSSRHGGWPLTKAESAAL